MSSLDLAEIVQALFAGDRGLLAMDESVETWLRPATKDLPKWG
jgi:hypothetical protein